MKIAFALFLLLVFPTVLHGITTIHHDKPEDAKISQMASKMSTRSAVTLERQKRLLPYINYYLNNRQKSEQPQNYNSVINHQQRKLFQPAREEGRHNGERFTPFLESNALPGPFIPIVKNTPKPFEYTSPRTEKVPDFSLIYDTLVQLKQAQQQQISRPPIAPPQNRQLYRKPQQINYVPVRYYENRYENTPRVKTIIETYTPTDIDLSGETVAQKNYGDQRLVYAVDQPKQAIVEKIPPQNYRTTIVTTTSKPSVDVGKSVILYQREKEYTENPIVYAIQTSAKPQANAIVDEKYIAQKYTPITSTKQYTPVQFVTERYEPKRYQYYSSPASNTIHKPVPVQENSLGKILKQLQNSNTLPSTLTPDNIDNSIKTLVKILNGLRKQQRLKFKPIVVADEDDSGEYEESEENEDDTSEEEHTYVVPGTVTQTFPADTVEGGTPGRPGIDYPALSSIPQTSFNCKTQRYKGFFGDPHTNCQVWHYCDLNGGQASFLCPNGTIFSQVALTCDWWFNVKCSSTPQLYVLNERLYKYIIPLAPKFPEDYSGPLVDRYLALKFQEMEEKMKNEKKKDDKSESEKDDSDQLQDIQNEKTKSSEETT